jgi:hypothetical protein
MSAPWGPCQNADGGLSAETGGCSIKIAQRPAGRLNEVKDGGAAWTNLAGGAIVDGKTTLANLNNTSLRTNTLVYDQFGFVLPVGSKITGLEFTVHRYSFDGLVRDQQVRLIAEPSKNLASTAFWRKGTTPDTAVYGGPNETFGAALSAATLNQGTFGLSLTAEFVTGTVQDDGALVDGVTARVFYCE